MGKLVLSRKKGQKILIGDNISIVVLNIIGGQVKIGIEAPDEIRVYREELFNEIISLKEKTFEGAECLKKENQSGLITQEKSLENHRLGQVMAGPIILKKRVKRWMQ